MHGWAWLGLVNSSWRLRISELWVYLILRDFSVLGMAIQRQVHHGPIDEKNDFVVYAAGKTRCYLDDSSERSAIVIRYGTTCDDPTVGVLPGTNGRGATRCRFPCTINSSGASRLVSTSPPKYSLTSTAAGQGAFLRWPGST
jgi:hypothetical protein